MTDERVALIDLIEKRADNDLVRDILSFVAERLMEAERCAPGRRTACVIRRATCSATAIVSEPGIPVQGGSTSSFQGYAKAATSHPSSSHGARYPRFGFEVDQAATPGSRTRGSSLTGAMLSRLI